MNSLTWFFLESVPALGAVLGLLLFGLLVYWRRSGRGRPLLVGLGLAAALLLIQCLVVTRREHADRILRSIERDIVMSRTDALAAALAPDFESGGLDREGFVAYVRRQLGHVKVRWVDRWRLEIVASEADRFLVTAIYTADVGAEGHSGTVSGTWSIVFVRTPDGWKMSRLQLERIDDLANPTWHDLNRSRGV